MDQFISERIRTFGNRFRERVDQGLLDAALEWLDHGENGLAFELVCDLLAEYYISITRDEYDEMIRLAIDMGYNMEEDPFHLTSMEGLVE